MSAARWRWSSAWRRSSAAPRCCAAGALVIAGALPVWNGSDPSNIGFLLAGIAVAISGALDHRLFVQTFGRPNRFALEEGDVGTWRGDPARPAHPRARPAGHPDRALLGPRGRLRLPATHDGLTKGNLSSHLAKLEEAGLVVIEKRFSRKKPNTNVALTAEGRRRIERHWEQLERLKSLAANGDRA